MLNTYLKCRKFLKNETYKSNYCFYKMLCDLRFFLVIKPLYFAILFIIGGGVLEPASSEFIGRQGQPKLNTSSATIDVNLNSFIYLQCSGQFVLSWGFIDPMAKEKGYQDVTAQGTQRSISTGSGFESITVLEFTSYLNTGKYVCYYNNSLSTRTASIYIFVNDMEHLLLPSEHPLTWMDLHQSKAANIPCHPTVSTANVTLWKRSYVDEMVHLNEVLRFDPTEGYTLIFPSSYFQGAFHCKATIGGFEAKLEFYFDFVRETQVIPRVYIDKSDAEYVLVNSNFSLTCIVQVEMGTSFFKTWGYPVENSDRVSIGKVKKNEAPRDHIYQETSETLQVAFAQKSDEGTYQCNVTDHSQKSNYYEVHVNVYENPQQTTVEFTTSIDINSSIIATKGEKLELKASYKTFPYSIDISLLWTKAGTQILQSVGKYLLQQSDADCTLTVFNLTRYDAGLYVLTAHASGGISNISFHVQVKDVPVITIKNSTCCYIPGRVYQILCYSEGLPLPDITWSWKKYCTEIDSDDNWLTLDEESPINNATISYGLIQGQNDQVFSSLRVLANESGYYKCNSKNELGIAEEKVPFIVTDIKNGFEIICVEEFPLEKEPFAIRCEASLDLFSSLQWSWKPDHDNRSFLVIEENLIETKSSRTIALELKYEAMGKNQSGIYACTAFLNSEENTRNESVLIVVKEKIEPFFTHTNLNASKLALSPNSMLELNCYVDGNPYPTISWYRNSKLYIANMSGGRFEDDFQKLIISRLVKEDSGDYECKATNAAGTISRNITLVVLTEDTLATSKAKEADPNQIAILTVVGVGAVSTIILLSLVSRWIYRRKKARMKFQYFNPKHFQEGQMALFNPDMALDEQVELLPYDERWEFPKDRLQLGRTLGQGAFGRVVKAEAIGLNDSETSTTVAVKMLKERADPNQQKALLAELKILIHLGHHVNIVNLLGAVTRNILRGELMVIVEYCRYGNLRHYLLRHRDNFINQIAPQTGCLNYAAGPCSPRIKDIFHFETNEANSPLFAVENPNYRERTESYGNSKMVTLQRLVKASDDSPNIIGHSPCYSSGSGGLCKHYYRIDSHEHKVSTCDLLCYAFQCARGMEYLASRKLIHRDLAARNILLAEDKVVKICDFGLAKDCYKDLNYVKKGDGPLPIKWMAIESIGDKVFTTKSDVWSFGILMWEFFTLGSNPYPGIEVDEEFYRRLKIGYRMERPEYCPNEAYQIMQNCWKADPNQRPEFTQISEAIGELLETGVKQHYVDLNDPYLEMNQETLMHDYLNTNAVSGNSGTQIYVNSGNIGYDINEYDNVPPVRSISDKPVPKEAMEAVPMIHLESISEERAHENSKDPTEIEHEKYTNNASDYLQMGTSYDTTLPLSTQEDSVFY